ncbi:fungal specific transcription factor [Trichoderma arundinaceum]|uniref:Fungal specific transcription factor n=1 Tax=Trichoderma arundinaceum TaxID=490622 RepID=A0A395NQ16_TRIAR|nr:fungal specific transcription factor [Trichoderma arundinaceum]
MKSRYGSLDFYNLVSVIRTSLVFAPTLSWQFSIIVNGTLNISLKTKTRDVDKLLERIKQLESALAQAHAPQWQNVAEAPERTRDLNSTIVNEDKNAEIPGTDDRPKRSAAQSLSLTQPSSQTSDDGIDAHITFATRLFGQNWYHRGLPIVSEDGLEWIASRTDEDTTTLRSYLSRGRPAWHFSAVQEPIPVGELWSLPDRNLVYQWFSALPTASFQILLPLLDKVLFEETINATYQSPEGIHASSTHVSARACFWAACAVMSHLKISDQAPMSVGSNVCAARAEWFLGLANGPSNLDILQTLVLLQKYRAAAGQYNSAQALHSTACRMLCELNGHLHQPINHSRFEHSLLERRRSHTRKLFWLCYMTDKDLSLSSGLPPILANEYCDLAGAEEYLNHDNFLHAPNEAIEDFHAIAWDRVIPFLSGDTHLGMLKEKIFRLLYSPSALKILDSELLNRIRRLDDDLESWRLSLPVALRPKLSINHDLPSTHTFSGYLRSVQLQLEYHYLLTVIHTPVRRFGAAQNAEASPPEELHSVMHSSIDLSLEASRSTLNLLNEPIAMLKQESFWSAHVVAAQPAAAEFLAQAHIAKPPILVHIANIQSDERIEAEISAVYHVDCFNIIGKSATLKEPSLDDVWTIALWTQSVSSSRYQAPPEVAAGFGADKTLIDEDGSILARISDIPHELRDMIAQLCPDSLVWRCASALRRWRTFQPLLDSDTEIKSLSFNDIKYWGRKTGLVTGNDESGKVRITVDGLGISQLEYVNDSSPRPDSHLQNVWYVVEEVSNMQGAIIEIKGPFMRLRKIPSFNLWDSPTPPDPTLTFWNRDKAASRLIRSVSLEEITGLTVVCERNAVRWIHAHREDLFPQDNSPPVVHDSSWRSNNKWTDTIFFPLAKGEKISSIWIRRCPLLLDIMYVPDTFASSLQVITTTGRYQLFGKYLCPTRKDVQFERLVSNCGATHLLIQDFGEPYPRSSHFAVASASARDTGPLPVLPRQISQSRGDSMRLTYFFLQTLPLDNVQKMWLFRPLFARHSRERRGIPQPWQGEHYLCRGMMLKYNNGTVAAAGDCRLGRYVDVELIESPKTIYHRDIYEVGRVEMACTTQEADADDAIGEWKDWECTKIDHHLELRWWFEDTRENRITTAEMIANE